MAESSSAAHHHSEIGLPPPRTENLDTTFAVASTAATSCADALALDFSKFHHFSLPMDGPGHVTVSIGRGGGYAWDDFVARAPTNSLAVDGVIEGPSRIFQRDDGARFASFDHHVGVVRLATLSSVKQVFDALRSRQLESFTDSQGDPELRIVLGLPDQDSIAVVAVAQALHEITRESFPQRINEFVDEEDFIDRYGGILRRDVSDPLMRQMAWAFDPYVKARPRINTLSLASVAEIVTTCTDRIQKIWRGEGEQIDLDTSSVAIGGGPGWTMIRELGEYGRASLARSQFKAYVTVRNLENGNYWYTLGKIVAVDPFPLPHLYAVLNAREQLCGGCARWGGSDFTGGSPFVYGSSIEPLELEAIINTLMRWSARQPLNPERVREFIERELPYLC